MSTSAQRDLYEEMFENQAGFGATGTDGAAGLRRIAAERLAAHRNRRVVAEPRFVESPQATPVISAAAQRARDAVAARYKQTPSFQEFLETQPASVPASKWVEEAVQVAQPVAGVVEEIVVETPLTGGAELLIEKTAAVVADAEPWDWQTNAVAFEGELEVRPYTELPQPQPLPERSRAEAAGHPAAHAEEIEGLEEEIEFRLAPEFVEHHIEPLPIQANIIEFPRQLVAAKKARPRIAEGPLRSDEVTEVVATVAAEPVPDFQMRIFEVEGQVEEAVEEPSVVVQQESAVASVMEPVVAEPRAPEWQELVLDTPKKLHGSAAQRSDAAVLREHLPVARFELRLMSAVVDAVCVAMSFVVFVSVAVWMSGHAGESALHEISIPVLAAAAVAGLAVLMLVYQAVFFTLGATTPGMSYAGLVFRTLAGKEPSRKALRRRVGANVVAAAPLGVGLLWSVFDGQRLGWNDRMSGVFLREF